jgi:hypothetical protein
MGSINSKSTNDNNYSNRFHTTNYNRYSLLSQPPSFLSSCTHQNDSKDIQHCDIKRRFCLKKKVLILGLDGVGKTDLFTRLISPDQEKFKIHSLPRPTIGKFI